MGRPRKFPLPLNAEDGQKYTATASHSGNVLTIDGNEYYRDPKTYAETDVVGVDEFGDIIRARYPQQHDIFKNLRVFMQDAINRYKDALRLYDEIGRFVPDGVIGETEGVIEYNSFNRCKVPQKLDVIVHDIARDYNGTPLTTAVRLFEELVQIDKNIVY